MSKLKSYYELGCPFWWNNESHCNHVVNQFRMSFCKDEDKWKRCKNLLTMDLYTHIENMVKE